MVASNETRDREQLLRLLQGTGLDLTPFDDLTGPWLTTTEVALLLGTSDRTIRKWADQGKIAVVKTLGGRRRFPAAGVLSAMEAMVCHPGTDEHAISDPTRGNG